MRRAVDQNMLVSGRRVAANRLPDAVDMVMRECNCSGESGKFVSGNIQNQVSFGSFTSRSVSHTLSPLNRFLFFWQGINNKENVTTKEQITDLFSTPQVALFCLQRSYAN